MGSPQEKWPDDSPIRKAGLVKEFATKVSEVSYQWKNLPSIEYDLTKPLVWEWIPRLEPKKSQILPLYKTPEWLVYTIDWNNYVNAFVKFNNYFIASPQEIWSDKNRSKYNPEAGIAYYFNLLRDMTTSHAESIDETPYCGVLSVLGKTWPIKWNKTQKRNWILENIQFGDYDIQKRVLNNNKLGEINPGLKLLIGIRTEALEQLMDIGEQFDTGDLAPEHSIITRIDAYEESFSNIIKVLEVYKKERESTTLRAKAKAPNYPDLDFEKEIGYIEEFLASLTVLIDKTKDSPWTESCAERRPDNIIEIGVNKNWTVAYVREYCAKKQFDTGDPTSGGSFAIGRLSLGGIEDSRFLNNPAPALKEFFNSKSVERQRTVAYISKLHGENNINSGLTNALLQNKIFNNTEASDTVIDAQLENFIREYTYPFGIQSEYLKRKHPLQELSDEQSGDSVFMSNHMNYLDNSNMYGGDPYISSIMRHPANFKFSPTAYPELSQNPKHLELDVYDKMLNNTGLNHIIEEVLRCLNPLDFLEIMCQMAVSHLGLDKVMHNIQKLDKKLANMFKESSPQAGAFFKAYEEKKELLEKEHVKLLNDQKKIDAQINDIKRQISKETNKKKLRALERLFSGALQKLELINLDILYVQTIHEHDGVLPIAREDMNREEDAKAFRNAMQDMPPELKAKICKEVIKYSVKAYEFYLSVTSGQYKKNIDREKKKRLQRLENTLKFDLSIDDIGNQLLSFFVQLNVHMTIGVILQIVKTVLRELLEVCKKYKEDLLNSIYEDDQNKLPGQASFKDALASTPHAVAQDIAGYLSDDPVQDLEGLMEAMEDLESIFTPSELCSLLSGNPPTHVIQLVKNLLKIKYPSLYDALKGDETVLSKSKIIEFFAQFEQYLGEGYCSDVIESNSSGYSIQLYQDCKPSTNTISIKESLLSEDGTATKEQIDDLIRKEKIDRLDMIKELVDLATSEDIFGDKSNCNPDGTPKGIPPSTEPLGAIQNMVIDQTIGSLEPIFKSEFSDLVESLLGIGDSASLDMLRNMSKDGKDFSKMSNEDLGDLLVGTMKSKDEKKILESMYTSLNAAVAPDINQPFAPIGTPAINEPITFGLATNVKPNNITKLDYKLLAPWPDGSSKPPEITYTYTVGRGTAQAEYKPHTIISDSPPLTVKRSTEFKNFLKSSWYDLSLFSTDGDWEVPIFRAQMTRCLNTIANNLADRSILFNYRNTLNELYILEGYLFDYIQDVGSFEPVEGALQDEQSNKIVLDDLVNTEEGFVPKYTNERSVVKEYFSDVLEDKQLVHSVSKNPKCDPAEDTSLLKIQQAKKYIKKRLEEMECDDALVCINSGPSNALKSAAEGVISILVRVYAYEAALRLLPMAMAFRIGDPLNNKEFINLVLESALEDMKDLDERGTFKTSSAKYNSEYASENGKLSAAGFDADGNVIYVEYPPAPTLPLFGGESWDRNVHPKFHKHVKNTAYEMVKSKINTAKKKNEILVDPFDTNIDFQGLDENNPYDENALKYLLKEQLVTVSGYLSDKSFAKFGFPLENFYIWFLQQFEHKKELAENHKGGHGGTYFDLMRSTYFDEGLLKFNPGPTHHYTIADKVTMDSLGKKLENGGFVIEPYILVKQKKPLTLSYDIDNLSSDELTELGEQIKAKVTAYLNNQYDDSDPEVATFIEEAAAQTTKEILAGQSTTLKPDWGIGEVSMPKEFGDLMHKDGVKLNIRQWNEFFGSEEFAAKLRFTQQEKTSHAEYFDWKYGLRLVYVFPQTLNPTDFIINSTGQWDSDLIARSKREKTYKIDFSKTKEVLNQDDQSSEQTDNITYWTVPLIDVNVPVDPTTDSDGSGNVVPLSYFTYQNIYEDFPRGALYRKMVYNSEEATGHNAQFNTLFKNIFNLDNTLFMNSMLIYLQTLDLNEYIGVPMGGLFRDTKLKLREEYYASMNSHDHNYRPSSGRFSTEETRNYRPCPDDFFMMNNPIVSTASGVLKGLLRIPKSVLKQWITIVDPGWRILPKTSASAVAWFLERTDPAEWFNHLLTPENCATGAPKSPKPPTNLICPETRGLLSNDENKLRAVMLAMNIAETEQMFIFFEKWPSHLKYQSLNIDKYQSFKDTSLFKILLENTNGSSLNKIKPVIPLLKEYIDTFAKIEQKTFEAAITFYDKVYKPLLSKLDGDIDLYKELTVDCGVNKKDEPAHVKICLLKGQIGNAAFELDKLSQFIKQLLEENGIGWDPDATQTTRLDLKTLLEKLDINTLLEEDGLPGFSV